jgi:hypothetical protein
MTAALIMLSLMVVGSGAFVALAVYQLNQSYNALITDPPVRVTFRTTNRPKARWA